MMSIAEMSVVALFTVLLQLGAPLALAAVIFEEDDHGALHLNTSTGGPIYINNVELTQMQRTVDDLLCRFIPPSLDTSTFSHLPPDTFKWRGSVIDTVNADGRGKIYGIPSSSASVLVVDPSTNSLDFIALDGLPMMMANKWHGGVQARNGKIYGIPSSSTSVLIVDPISNTTDISTLHGLPAQGYKWIGGVLVDSGKIYAIPCSSAAVLIIDPDLHTVDMTSVPLITIEDGLADGALRWAGGVLAKNGKIYCIPFYSSAVLIIDPVTNTVDTTSLVGLPSTSSKWNHGVLAENGRIYAFPRDFSAVLIIDPSSNSTDFTSISNIPSVSNSWSDGVLAGNGKVYMIPYSSSTVLILDPSTNAIDVSTFNSLSAQTHKWGGGVLALNGRIYGLPFSSTSILVIQPGCVL
eukprot:m.28505 g.28505  ORF g.28505 m.28505 type:complete len:408 (-) comp10453_c0_seq2:644-1867(-)